jgi:ATP-dependent DNA helicase RecG
MIKKLDKTGVIMIENQDVEYKLSWQDRYLETISAFANSKGGTLYIGIDDNGSVKGLDDKKFKRLYTKMV